MLDICLLGTGGMMPTPNRFLASAMIRYDGTNILIDCGEGTQMPLQELGWGFKDINTILFTHYHGDHITGLPGILFQMANANRTEPLTLMGPKGINILKHLVAVVVNLKFKVNYVELPESSEFNIGKIIVKNIALKHTTTCYGYSFEIKRLKQFDVEKAKLFNIPITAWRTLQNGNEYYDETHNTTYTPDMVLGKERKGLKVSYAVDTRPIIAIQEFIYDSDLYIGEGMYGNDDEIGKAIEKCHSTAVETAKLAALSNVKELWLTHYSPSFRNYNEHTNNLKKTFENAKWGRDLMQITLNFND